MFVKPGELKGLTVITIHVPDQVVPGKYTVRHEIRNIAGKVILSDDIGKDSMAYICRAVNGAEILEQQVKQQDSPDQDRNKKGKELYSFAMVGKTVIRKDSKVVLQDESGNFVLKPTTVYNKWLAYHKRKRYQYLGTWSMPKIALPVNVSMKFVMPRSAGPVTTHHLIESTLDCLRHIGVLYRASADIVKSVDGTEVIYTDGTEYLTHVSITRVGKEQGNDKKRKRKNRS